MELFICSEGVLSLGTRVCKYESDSTEFHALKIVAETKGPSWHGAEKVGEGEVGKGGGDAFSNRVLIGKAHRMGGG